jgi:CheY-like chemotaxis protein
MNGYDATKAIRFNKGINTTTPIFALTADITADQQEEYTSLFDGFLRKPIEIDHMYAALTNTNNQ